MLMLGSFEGAKIMNSSMVHNIRQFLIDLWEETIQGR